MAGAAAAACAARACQKHIQPAPQCPSAQVPQRAQQGAPNTGCRKGAICAALACVKLTTITNVSSTTFNTVMPAGTRKAKVGAGGAFRSAAGGAACHSEASRHPGANAAEVPGRRQRAPRRAVGAAGGGRRGQGAGGAALAPHTSGQPLQLRRT